MKIDDVYEEYINFTPLSPRTKSMYLKCYNNFWKNIIGHLDINELSYNIVQSGINFLIKKYSYNTIKIYKCAVFKFIDIAQLKNDTKYERVKCINIGKPPKKKELYTKIMLDNNASIESVRALLGHANVSTTLNIYLRGNVEERKSDVDKVFNSKKYVKKA